MPDTIWTAIIILCLVFFFYIYTRIDESADNKKAVEKTKAAEPIDGTFWLYDSTGAKQRVQDKARELRRITYGKGERE